MNGSAHLVCKAMCQGIKACKQSLSGKQIEWDAGRMGKE